MRKIVLTIGISVMLFAGGLDEFKGMSGTLRIAGGTAHIPVRKLWLKR